MSSELRVFVLLRTVGQRKIIAGIAVELADSLKFQVPIDSTGCRHDHSGFLWAQFGVNFEGGTHFHFGTLIFIIHRISFIVSSSLHFLSLIHLGRPIFRCPIDSRSAELDKLFDFILRFEMADLVTNQPSLDKM